MSEAVASSPQKYEDRINLMKKLIKEQNLENGNLIRENARLKEEVETLKGALTIRNKRDELIELHKISNTDIRKLAQAKYKKEKILAEQKKQLQKYFDEENRKIQRNVNRFYNYKIGNINTHNRRYYEEKYYKNDQRGARFAQYREDRFC